MKKQGLIYITALKRFIPGEIAFDEKFTSLSPLEDVSKRDWIIPGLVDVHMHIESSMLTPTSFSIEALRHGTTTIVSDSHEIANVFGVNGLLEFMGKKAYCDVFYAIPSSVPASSGELETTGGSFDKEEVEILAKDKRIIALGEIMNANDLTDKSDNRTKRIIKAFHGLRPECPIEGHIPSRITGKDLDAFLLHGVDSDHTGHSLESVKEKLMKGIFLEFQLKSLTKELVGYLSSHPELDGHYALCTDDTIVDALCFEGHLDRVVKKAISLGLSPERAIYASTYAPSVRMRLFDRGMIAPGRIADFIVTDESLQINEVWKGGNKVYSKDKGILIERNEDVSGDYAYSSIKRNRVSPKDFLLRTGVDGNVRIRCVTHLEKGTLTPETTLDARSKDGIINDERVNILASVERYGHQGEIIPVPLVGGMAKRGAIASSWAHDSHNMLVMATDADLAAMAVNLVIKRQGGIVALDDKEEIFAPLPYGGVVSDGDAAELAKKIKAIRAFLSEHGYRSDEEIMSFATLALPVSPYLKVTDKGLVDVKEKRIINWMVEG